MRLRTLAVLDTVVVTSVVASYIWWWRARLPLDGLLLAGTLIGWSIFLHRSRGETLVDVTGRAADLPRAARCVLSWVGLPVIALSAYALVAYPVVTPPLPDLLARLATLILLGIAQQYLLLAHLSRSTSALVSNSLGASMLAAGVFALLHLPNPFLVATTWVAGLVACHIYRRAPHVIAIGVGHGCLSFALYYGLPRALTGGLRFGPAFP